MKFKGLGLSLFAAASFSVSGQSVIINGDFSSGLDSWNLVQPPGNLPVTNQPGLFDVVNSGPLSAGNSFYAHIGYDSLVNLQQTISLSAGVTYDFYADIGTSTPQYNVDGGTISIFIDGNGIDSHSFGAGIGQIASLSGAYTPQQSGDAVLSIDFSRSYLASDQSPTDWIDNITLTAVPEPSCLGLGVCGSILFWFKWRNSQCNQVRVAGGQPG